LTKEERAAEAIKRRQEQVDAQRKVLEEERKKQDEFMKAAKESGGHMIDLYIKKYCSSLVMASLHLVQSTAIEILTKYFEFYNTYRFQYLKK